MAVDIQTINVDDVRIAIQDLDPEKRANATIRLSRSVKNPALSEDDRRFANRALDVISKDVSALVRRALAVTLKNSPFIPKAVVTTLLKDIESIAVPLITHSPLLTDEDLSLVIKSGVAGKIQAVAGRKALSNRIILSLINTGDASVARNIAANDEVPISEDAAQAMIETYREDDLIRASLMQRASMPMSVVEKLVAASASDIADRLYAQTDLTRPQTISVGLETYERTTTQLSNDHFSENTLRELVSAIHKNGRLSAELVIRAMGLGKIGLVHYGLAALAGLSVRKTVLMLHDTSSFALRGLCVRAGFDEAQTAFMTSAIRVYSHLETSGEKLTAREFQLRMIERILTLPIKIDSRDEDYFLNILDSAESDDAG